MFHAHSLNCQLQKLFIKPISSTVSHTNEMNLFKLLCLFLENIQEWVRVSSAVSIVWVEYLYVMACMVLCVYLVLLTLRFISSPSRLNSWERVEKNSGLLIINFEKISETLINIFSLRLSVYIAWYVTILETLCSWYYDVTKLLNCMVGAMYDFDIRRTTG